MNLSIKAVPPFDFGLSARIFSDPDESTEDTRMAGSLRF